MPPPPPTQNPAPHQPVTPLRRRRQIPTATSPGNPPVPVPRLQRSSRPPGSFFVKDQQSIAGPFLFAQGNHLNERSRHRSAAMMFSCANSYFQYFSSSSSPPSPIHLSALPSRS